MSVDIQWFIYALVSNGVLSPEDAVAVFSSLGDEFSDLDLVHLALLSILL